MIIMIPQLQIEDIQNQMDHATGYLKSRLAEQEGRSELSKMQVIIDSHRLSLLLDI